MDAVIRECMTLDAACKELVSVISGLKCIELSPDDKRNVMEKAAIATKALIDLRQTLPQYPFLASVVAELAREIVTLLQRAKSINNVVSFDNSFVQDIESNGTLVYAFISNVISTAEGPTGGGTGVGLGTYSGGQPLASAGSNQASNTNARSRGQTSQHARPAIKLPAPNHSHRAPNPNRLSLSVLPQSPLVTQQQQQHQQQQYPSPPSTSKSVFSKCMDAIRHVMELVEQLRYGNTPEFRATTSATLSEMRDVVSLAAERGFKELEQSLRQANTHFATVLRDRMMDKCSEEDLMQAAMSVTGYIQQLAQQSATTPPTNHVTTPEPATPSSQSLPELEPISEPTNNATTVPTLQESSEPEPSLATTNIAEHQPTNNIPPTVPQTERLKVLTFLPPPVKPAPRAGSDITDNKPHEDKRPIRGGSAILPPSSLRPPPPLATKLSDGSLDKESADALENVEPLADEKLLKKHRSKEQEELEALLESLATGKKVDEPPRAEESVEDLVSRLMGEFEGSEELGHETDEIVPIVTPPPIGAFQRLPTIALPMRKASSSDLSFRQSPRGAIRSEAFDSAELHKMLASFPTDSGNSPISPRSSDKRMPRTRDPRARSLQLTPSENGYEEDSDGAYLGSPLKPVVASNAAEIAQKKKTKKSGAIIVGRLDKGHWYTGDTMLVGIEIDNTATKKPVKNLELALFKKSSTFKVLKGARKPTAQRVLKVAEITPNLSATFPIKPGCNADLKIPFEIPKDLAPSSMGDMLSTYEVFYFLRAAIGKGAAKAIELGPLEISMAN